MSDIYIYKYVVDLYYLSNTLNYINLINFKLKTINIIKLMALSNLNKDNLTRLFKMINIDDYSNNQNALSNIKKRL
jgi:hypothetical protein